MTHPADPKDGKPGPSHLICTTCGDDWPCHSTQIDRQPPEETHNTPQPKGNPHAN